MRGVEPIIGLISLLVSRCGSCRLLINWISIGFYRIGLIGCICCDVEQGGDGCCGGEGGGSRKIDFD
jgi:hypothetical protein